MKRNQFLPLLAAAMLVLAGCENNDNYGVNPDPDPDPQPNFNIRINEISYAGTADRVELKNFGSDAADVRDFLLCSRLTYKKLSDLTVEEGSLNIPAGGLLVVSGFALDDTAADVGLYEKNEFANAEAMHDFVQYGSAGHPRENVAVTKGIWTAGDFVPGVAQGHSIEFDGEGRASTDWFDQAAPTFGNENSLVAPPAPQPNVRINEVFYSTADDQIEIKNFSMDQAVDISEMWLCSLFGYKQVKDMTVVSGDLNIPPCGVVVVSGFDLNDNAADLGLYETNTFADTSAMLDFVQYGSAGLGRENVAAGKGIWTAGDFIATVGAGHSIEYDGEGRSSTDWFDQNQPTLGADNRLQPAPELKIRINELLYSTGDDRIELKNFGDTDVDVSDLWVCSLFAYRQLKDMTVVNGSLTIPAGEILVLSGFALNDAAADFAIYTSNAFASADAMLDFVQYGGQGLGRENVAVDKGIWTAGDFVPTVAAGHSIEFDGEGRSSSDWIDQAQPTVGAENSLASSSTTGVRINELLYAGATDQIELKNFGSEAVDISEWWVCALFAYRQIKDMTVVTGSLTIPAGGVVVLGGFNLNDTASDFAIYNTNAFASADAMIDFVQYGGAGLGRENVAAAKNIWTPGEFVPTVAAGHSIEFDGEGRTAADWIDQPNPTLGAENTLNN